jgi:hypothetical protein
MLLDRYGNNDCLTEIYGFRRDGIHFCNIRYWSDALAADVGQQGRQEVDETLLFKTALRQREIVDAARRQTVATRVVVQID